MASSSSPAAAAEVGAFSWQRGLRATAASLCRGHFYKLVAATVVAFLLLEYSFNMLSTNQKAFRTVSPGLSWIFRPLPGDIAIPESASPYSVNKSRADKIFPTAAHRDSNSTTTPAMELCPLVPPNLVGRLKVLKDAPSFETMEKEFPQILPGGRYKPKDCTARHRVAILVPYRDREDHLRVFLYNMHQMLPRQQIDYAIFVIEQAGQGRFNRAKLFNVGYLEALALYDYQCFIFHDVDLIPEDDRNLYTCPEQPRHMSVAIDTMKYRLPYALIFGGVSALKKEHMQLVNGFSNEYWGWGGEDDDMSYRLQHYHLKISRYPANIARYTMLKHAKDTPSPDRYKLLYKGKLRYKKDGINSVHYERLDIVFKKLYTWILVDLKGK
uniref:Beta-1,4-N-acetylgalactosaminyltransferase n=1 Tax=Amblyomma aureolatum TaxID=187763 RepID=A0A1E1XG56_9ACAR